MLKEAYNPLREANGYLLKQIPSEICPRIKKVVDNIQNNFSKASPANKFLVGQIDKEYKTQLDNTTTQYIRSLVDEYDKSNPQYLIQKFQTNKPTLKYNGHCWINFQKKHEYNPIHNHSGIFSFVIWHQIPFYKEDEIKYGAGKGKRPQENCNGEFHFVYTSENKIWTTPLPIDKTMEGHIAIFPSSLDHTVYPFYTSEDYRITLSGNIL